MTVIMDLQNWVCRVDSDLKPKRHVAATIHKDHFLKTSEMHKGSHKNTRLNENCSLQLYCEGENLIVFVETGSYAKL